MPKQKLDPQFKGALQNAKKMMQDCFKANGNEAETRRRVERMFDTLMGYKVFKHITRELAVKGPGNTEHCDFAIHIGKIGKDKKTIPEILIELKRVNTKLSPKNLKQISHYAIDIGCAWAILTNGIEWKLYNISFGKPPQTKLVEQWNLLEDTSAKLAEKFKLISFKEVKKGSLDKLLELTNVLTIHNILKVILSEQGLKMIRRELKKDTGISVPPEDIVSPFRRMLNEKAGSEMENIKISLPIKN